MAEFKYVDWDGLVYYDGKIKDYIEDLLHGCIKIGGDTTIEQLPSPSFQNLNYVYKITKEFTSNDWFEKPGYIYEAGTLVQVTDLNNAYLYTIFNEEININNYYTKSQVIDLIKEAIDSIDMPDVPSTVAELADSYLYVKHTDLKSYVEDSDLDNYAKKSDIEDLASIEYVDTKIPNDYVTEDTVTGIVEKQVETVMESNIELAVEKVIQQKFDDGEVTITTDKIEYGSFD